VPIIAIRLPSGPPYAPLYRDGFNSGRNTPAVFMAKPDMTTPSPTENFFEKKFLGKRDSHVRRLGANKDQVSLPDKGMGVGTTTFKSALTSKELLSGNF
jgi:hypothetical protein